MRKLLTFFLVVVAGLSLSAQCPPSAPLSLPYSENFDNEIAGTAGSTGTFGNCYINTSGTTTPRWEYELSGAGNSGNTGPLNDFSGTGLYAYFETSGGSAGDTSGLITPQIDLGSVASPELEFFYHMFGLTMGDLEVYVNNGSGWTLETTISGQQQTSEDECWKQAFVSLSAYIGDTIQIKFLGERGSSFTGDISIDEIQVEQASNCPIPTDLTFLSATTTTATLRFDSVTSASSYNIYYGAPGFDPATATPVSFSNDTVTLTGLSAATIYEAYVEAVCGANNSGVYCQVSFSTNCVPYTATYTRDFENDQILAPALCWSEYSNLTSAFAQVRTPSVFNAVQPFSGTKLLELNVGSFSSSDTLIAYSPQFSDMSASDKQIKMQVASSSTSNSLYVGTSNAQLGGTINILDTITFSSNAWQLYILPLNASSGYNGTDDHLVFMHGGQSTFSDIYIEDFVYEAIPACPQLLNVSLNSVGITTATFNYNSGGNPVQYEWGPIGFNQGTGTSGSLTAGSGTISGLSSASCYDVYLRTDCTASGNGNSVWSGPFTVCTLCNTQSLPYSENFEIGLGCFVVSDGGNTTDTWRHADASNSTTTTSGTALDNSTGWVEVDSDDAGSGAVTLDEELTSAYIDAGNISGTLYLEFDQHYFHLGSNALVDIWDGSTWVNILNQTSSVGGFANPDHQKIDITAYANDSLQVRFTYKDNGSWAWWWVIDNVLVQEELCARSTNFRTTFTAADSLGLAWDPGAGNSFSIEYGPTGFSQGAGTVLNTSDSSITITGLTSQTGYDFYLVDSCSGSVASLATFLSATTACSLTTPAILPWNDDFESYTQGPSFTSQEFLCNSSYSWALNPSSSGRFRLQAGAAYYRGGSQALTIDRNSGTPANQQNELILSIDLSSYSTANGVELSFYWQRHTTQSRPNNKVYARGSLNDPWVELASLNNPSSGSYDSIIGMDIVGPLAQAGQSLSNTSQLRWVEEGRFSTTFGPTCCDGYTIDDVSLEAVSCPKPGNLSASSILDTTATLNWASSSSANSFQYWVGPAGFYQGTATTTGFKALSSASGVVVDTLSPATCYEFLVRRICQAGDSSAWAGPFSFCTTCSPISAPYFEDWDLLSSGTSDLGCFSAIEDPSLAGTTFNGLTIQSSTFFNTVSAPNYLEMDNSSIDNAPLILVSPPTSDMTAGDKRLVFFSRMAFNASPATEIIVGTMSDANDANTFSALDTIATDPNSFQRKVVNITTANGYNGSDKFFAIAHGLNGTFRTVLIDDLSYEVIPSCPEASNLSALAVDSMNAQVTWDPFSGSTGTFQIEYGTDTLGSPNNSQVIATNDTTTLTNLMSGTNYCFWVREICSATDTSAWVGPECFKTSCTAINAVYIENWDTRIPFDDLGCYSAIEDASFANSNFNGVNLQNSSTLVPNSSPNYVELDNGFVTNSPLMLVSPLTNDLTAGDKRVEFWARESFAGTTPGTIIVGTMSDPADATTFNPLDTVTLGASSPANSYIVEFTTANGYNGTDDYYAFQHDLAGTFKTYLIDDIIYETIPSCVRPTGISQDSANLNSITLGWTSNGGGSSWVIEYGSVGFTPGSGTTIIANSNPYTITGLSSGSAYDVYVSEICNVGDTSLAVGPTTMNTTICAASSQCYYYFDLTDSFGDGWNGGLVAVKQNGITVATLGANFTTGSLYQDSVLLCDGLPTQVEVTDAGNWPSEMGITVTTPYGTTAATYTNSPSTVLGTIMATFSSTCNPPTCNSPSALNQTSAGLSSIDMNWTSNGTGTSWEIEYGSPGFTIGNGTRVLVTANPHSLTGLPSASAYDVYVREICSAGDTSTFTGPVRMGTSICQVSSQCNYILDLTDSFGDGWNGGEITVFQAGIEVGKFGSNFTTGSLFTDSVTLCDSIATSIVLTTAGGWPSEIGVVVKDLSQNTVATYLASPSTATGDTLVTFTPNCAGSQPCLDPTNLAITNNVGCDSIEVDWTSNSGGSLIEYGPAGFNLGSGTSTGVVTAPYVITGLNPASNYDIYIADTCSGDTSAFIAISGTTANAPLPVANFTIDSAIVNNVYEVYLDASGSSNANSYQWNFGNGSSSTNAVDTTVFTGNGNYVITLIVSNACGSDTATFNTNVNIGLNENLMSRSLHVYPNPALYNVTLSFDAVGSNDAEVRLLDASGREVLQKALRANNRTFEDQFDVSDLATGIYMIEVRSGDMVARRRLSVK